MDTLDAILTIEQDNDATEDEILDAWRHLISTGTVWHLQGFYQRTAVRLIESGIVDDPKWPPDPADGEGLPEPEGGTGPSRETQG